MKALLLLIGFTLASIHFAEAQTKDLQKIGLLSGFGLLPSSSEIEAFRQGLREFGYLEGQTLQLSTALRNTAIGLPILLPN